MEQHRDQGIRGLLPFADFDVLRRCFSEGKRWKISADWIQRLKESSLVTFEQAEIFRRDGVIGSHLEIPERNTGYRGCNQRGISEIIPRTDPRGNANPG
jgi:hypothetical protein